MSHGLGRSAGHRSLLSAASNSSSKFNAEAKEFTFNPGSFGNSVAKPISQNAFTPATTNEPRITAHANGAFTGAPSFNVNASSFKPPQSGNFDFSSKGISFNADKARQDQAEKQAEEQDEQKDQAAGKSKIFSHIEASDIVKPAKKSKAIPIINPNLNISTPAKPEPEPEEEDDEDGRLGPSSSRSKRGRFTQGDGDSVPRFASPSAAKLDNDLPVPPVLPSQMDQPLPPLASTPELTAIKSEKLTEKLIDLSDDSWHGGFRSEPRRSDNAKEVPKKDRATPVEPSKFEQPWRNVTLPTTNTVLRMDPTEKSANEPHEAAPVKSAYVPPHKRSSISQDGDKNAADASPVKDADELEDIDDVMGQLNDGNSDFGVEEGPISRGRSPLKAESSLPPSKPAHATVSPSKVTLEASKYADPEHLEASKQADASAAEARRHIAAEEAAQRPKVDPPVELVAPLQNLETANTTKPSKAAEPSKPNVSAGALEPAASKKLSQLAPQPLEPTRGVDAGWLRDQQKRASESPVRKLGGEQDPAVSDWDDILPSSEEFVPQAQFFDTRVRSLIENAIKKSLDPISKSMKDMRASVTRIHQDNDMRAMSAHEKSSSDADDEDDVDETRGSTSRSAGRKSDRKLDLMRMMITEVVRNNVPVASGSTDALEREISQRHDAERKLEDLQHLHHLNEKEIMLYRESAENTEHKIRSLEDVRRMSDEKVNELTSELEAMQETLDEYRSSSKKWRSEIDNAKSAREVLSGTIEKMRREVEENQRLREESADTVAQMRAALTDTSANLARERSLWQTRFEDQTKNNAMLSVKLDEVQRSRTHLEEEVERLALQEKLAIKSSIGLEESRNTVSKMEVEIAKLRADLTEHRDSASRFERDAMDAQDNAKMEAQRVRTLMEAELEVASKRADNTRIEYETRIEILRAELEGANAQAASTKGHFESMLAQSEGIRKQALQEAADAANARLKEAQCMFEKQLADLASQQQRDTKNVLEDRERVETHLSNNLKLADEKMKLQQDKITHLEDKVQVAQTAAQAAAAAAASTRSVSVAVPSVPQPTSTRPPLAVLPSATERVSPQALRESIAVLQEQLQAREGRIEQLESELDSMDKEGPAKLARAETEVGWLREVLQVRLDDLNDLVASLQLERFDRGAARNAAIRIRANMQMEQQEKERMLRGEHRTAPLPSLQDLQNFATPRAAQISAAWNSWRTGGQSPMGAARQALAAPTTGDETPSKRPSLAGQRNFANEGAASAQTFLSTLMTPPPSNLRRTPSTASARRPLQSIAAQPQLSKIAPTSPADGPHFASLPRSRDALTTPPLLAQDDYDQDADESRNFAYPASENGDEHETAMVETPTLAAVDDEGTNAMPRVHAIVERKAEAPTAPEQDDTLELPDDTRPDAGEVEHVLENSAVQPLGDELAQATDD